MLDHRGGGKAIPSLQELRMGLDFETTRSGLRGKRNVTARQDLLDQALARSHPEAISLALLLTGPVDIDQCLAGSGLLRYRKERPFFDETRRLLAARREYDHQEDEGSDRNPNLRQGCPGSILFHIGIPPI